jgi:hypothetical protein
VFSENKGTKDALRRVVNSRSDWPPFVHKAVNYFDPKVAKPSALTTLRLPGLLATTLVEEAIV